MFSINYVKLGISSRSRAVHDDKKLYRKVCRTCKVLFLWNLLLFDGSRCRRHNNIIQWFTWNNLRTSRSVFKRSLFRHSSMRSCFFSWEAMFRYYARTSWNGSELKFVLKDNRSKFYFFSSLFIYFLFLCEQIWSATSVNSVSDDNFPVD